MVNQKYLDQAVRIRKDFLSTDGELLFLQKKLKKVNENIENTLSKLKEIRNKSSEYHSDEEFHSDVMKYLKEFEEQGEQIAKAYEPLNDKMESLKKEEQELYKVLVQNYPKIDEESLIQEIQDYVRSKS